MFSNPFIIKSFILGTIMLVLSFLFSHKKGGMLIAGYNTLSPEKKKLYNNNIFKVVALSFFMISLLVYGKIFIYYFIFDNLDDYEFIQTVLIVVILLATIIIMNSNYVKK